MSWFYPVGDANYINYLLTSAVLFLSFFWCSALDADRRRWTKVPRRRNRCDEPAVPHNGPASSAIEFAQQVNPSIEVFVVSARTGEGMQGFYTWRLSGPGRSRRWRMQDNRPMKRRITKSIGDFFLQNGWNA
jgi:hypothetical protein